MDGWMALGPGGGSQDRKPTDEEPPSLSLSLLGLGLLVCDVFLMRSGLIDYVFDRTSAIVIWTTKYVPYATILVGFVAVAIGCSLHHLRDVKQHVAYGPLEILFGCVAASVGFQNNSLAGVLAFIGGLRVIADGYKRINSR